MNVTLRTPQMTREQFLDWVERQETPYEFDGFEPVAMNGSSVNHSQICHNLYLALRTRLRGAGCRVLGPNVGVSTTGNAVRYPDAFISCASLAGTERVVGQVPVIFEVISPGSARIDRVVKTREYASIPGLRRYVILEDMVAALTVFARLSDEAAWTAVILGPGEVLALPEVGIEVPVDELYLDVAQDTQTGGI